MQLRKLLKYKKIVIQCHDNPDADAIASGYALYCYFKKMGKKASLVYAGSGLIRKSNLVLMIESLGIPIKHVTEIDNPDLLVTVDCQYGEGNVTRFDAKEIAVIDHHRVSGKLPELNEIRSELGACATLMWSMLMDEGIDVNKSKKLITALYYGLYTDTAAFAEIANPLDRDLRDYAKCDVALITKLRNANMSLEELEIAGTALLRSDYVEEHRFSIVKSGPCDPNVLGIISDLVLGVDAVDVCLVFNVLATGVKLSVRSCIKEVRANELIAEITRGIGSGGGHFVKAGGFILMETLMDAYFEMCEKDHRSPRMELDSTGMVEIPSASGIKSLLEQRMYDYFSDTEIIYADDYEVDLEHYDKYVRRPSLMGYVMGTDIAKVGTVIKLRTVQGDCEVTITEQLIFLIKNTGKVIIESLDRFNQRYRCYPNWKFEIVDSNIYAPTAKVKHSKKVMTLSSLARVCQLESLVQVNARPLEHKVKLFSSHAASTYEVGKPGDMLIMDEGKSKHLYVLKKKSFEKEYILKMEQESHKKIEAVIFDLDGTLLDTLDDLRNSVNASLGEYGLPLHSLEDVRNFLGNGVRNLMKLAVPGGEGHPQFEEIFECFKQHYSQHCNDMTGPYKDIMELLEKLQKKGIRMGIVSNKIDSAVKQLADIYFAGYMKSAVGETEGVDRKPAPDMALRVMMELDVTPDKVLYVGDSDVDIQTANNAEIECISVTWGFRDEEFLREKGANHIIHEPLELLSYIENSAGGN